MVKEKVDVILGEELGEGPRYALSENVVHFASPKGGTVKEIMENTKEMVI
ncbi:hypothetical protein [Methanobacterium formicicum]|nr:hypothetical protein [Methanobacterium formicicum]